MTIDTTRSRRGRLDQEAVLQAAEALVDRDGYNALTMTSLAAALEAIEALAVMVRSAGLPEERLLKTVMALFTSLHGFVSLEVAGYFGDLSGTNAELLDLDEVYEQVIEGAVSAAVREAAH